MTTLWNGKGWRGMGANPRKQSGASGRSTSAGATNNAPATLARSGTGRAALIRQPRLWAISSTGLRAWSTSVASVEIHSGAAGFSQSRCWMRTAWGSRVAQRDCQWSGPEFFHPGTMIGWSLMAAMMPRPPSNSNE
ncbi:hypothetical protein G6F31_019970 [Rhizopus arrhizus]|nr:hypothetical protein G6F31_019970 [Rhizopus arrhizus]